MCKRAWCTFRAVFLLIKPIVFWRCRCCRMSLLIKTGFYMIAAIVRKKKRSVMAAGSYGNHSPPIAAVTIAEIELFVIFSVEMALLWVKVTLVIQWLVYLIGKSPYFIASSTKLPVQFGGALLIVLAKGQPLMYNKIKPSRSPDMKFQYIVCPQVVSSVLSPTGKVSINFSIYQTIYWV